MDRYERQNHQGGKPVLTRDPGIFLKSWTTPGRATRYAADRSGRQYVHPCCVNTDRWTPLPHGRSEGAQEACYGTVGNFLSCARGTLMGSVPLRLGRMEGDCYWLLLVRRTRRLAES